MKVLGAAVELARKDDSFSFSSGNGGTAYIWVCYAKELQHFTIINNHVRLEVLGTQKLEVVLE